MSSKNQDIGKYILFCNCRGERIAAEKLREIRDFLEKQHSEVIILSDLCGVVAVESVSVAEILKENTEYLVLGCFPRAMNLMFKQAAGFEKEGLKLNYINLINTSSEIAMERISEFCSGDDDHGSIHEINEGSGWPAWYPVIDYNRCTACGQCSDFCLFGVYEKHPGKVTVINPQVCKNQCPACARICPSSAIIFPKYKNGGAIGGSDEIDEKAELQRQARDIKLIMGDDIYSALRERKAKRKMIIREEALKKAIAEREKALYEKEQ